MIQHVNPSGSGFLSERRAHPSSLAIVIALHGAALAAALLVKSGAIPTALTNGAIDTIIVRPVEDPPLLPPPPEPDSELPPPPLTTTVLPLPPVFVQPDLPVRDFARPTPTPPPTQPVAEVTPPPLLIAARLDPAFAGRLQPPYPPSMIRQGIEGDVTVRVRIDASGRVVAVEKVSAADDALFEATRRHALRSWRFIPATRDGRPVESTQQQTVQFRIT